MLVCTLGGEGGGGLKKCTVCTLMEMLTFLDGPLGILPTPNINEGHAYVRCYLYNHECLKQSHFEAMYLPHNWPNAPYGMLYMQCQCFA